MLDQVSAALRVPFPVCVIGLQQVLGRETADNIGLLCSAVERLETALQQCQQRRAEELRHRHSRLCLVRFVQDTLQNGLLQALKPSEWRSRPFSGALRPGRHHTNLVCRERREQPTVIRDHVHITCLRHVRGNAQLVCLEDDLHASAKREGARTCSAVTSGSIGGALRIGLHAAFARVPQPTSDAVSLWPPKTSGNGALAVCRNLRSQRFPHLGLATSPSHCGPGIGNRS
mmetsp:Transcript_25460/g.66653  ORF Transcript_25460/g.66653 Transcript_25460/m.66653 type:complete len:230 (+) Transcript_25460:1930-2619(+)